MTAATRRLKLANDFSTPRLLNSCSADSIAICVDLKKIPNRNDENEGKVHRDLICQVQILIPLVCEIERPVLLPRIAK